MGGQHFKHSWTAIFPSVQPQAQGGASVQAQARPQVVFTSGGSRGVVPTMPQRMSNNRNKTWAKYVKLYNKTGDSAHLDVLNKMVSEESGQVQTAP